MKLTIFGSGYVGLVAGACFSDFGNTVCLVDVDARKVEALNRGQIPIFEPRLEDLVKRNREAGRLSFTTSPHDALVDTEAVFVAVGTPEGEDGSADLSYVEKVARTVSAYFQGPGASSSIRPCFVLKSTVPVGTADRCRALLPADIAIVNNPEFLKEGSAIEDFLRPERIVLGTSCDAAFQKMSELYAPFVRSGAPMLRMSNRSAEIAKYAANCFLAMKVSYINDLALFCEKTQADIYEVRSVLASDSRIGKQFLHPGPGYGGSCFPKDVQAFAHTARSLGHELPLIEATEVVNRRQKQVMPDRVIAFLETQKIAKARVAVWGLSFKPETDDIREAPALALLEKLLGAGHQVQAYDPSAMESVKRLKGNWLSGGLKLCALAKDALEGADALVVMTEWNEFRNPDFKSMAKKLSTRAVFDAKNLYREESLTGFGLRHFGIGLGTEKP